MTDLFITAIISILRIDERESRREEGFKFFSKTNEKQNTPT